MKFNTSLRILLLVCFWLVSRSAFAAPEFSWAEAETPAMANFEFETSAPKADLLSGGKWIQKEVKKEDLAALPAEGLTLRYALNAPSAGTYAAWARVGFEWVRAPLEWRVTDAKGTSSAWSKIEPTQATTNVKRLGFWMEVAWQKLGEVNLPAGATQLELRFREPNNNRVLFALDAVALVKGQWTPEGKLKPGEEYTSENDVKAAQQIYNVPKLTAARSELSLSGLWQVARYDDPDMDVDTYAPVQALPKANELGLHWKSIKVPSSAWDDDELAFGHRLIYRPGWRPQGMDAGGNGLVGYSNDLGMDQLLWCGTIGHY